MRACMYIYTVEYEIIYIQTYRQLKGLKVIKWRSVEDIFGIRVEANLDLSLAGLEGQV